MPDASNHHLLEALLDSWDRNNTITVNLLRAVPDGTMDASAMPGSPSIATLFVHMHYVRLVFVAEDAPEFARPMPREEWAAEHDRDRLAQMFDESARAVRDAVRAVSSRAARWTSTTIIRSSCCSTWSGTRATITGRSSWRSRWRGGRWTMRRWGGHVGRVDGEGQTMATIGLIGAGHIGSQVARLAIANGYDVVVSNSRGPESLAALVAELGPRARAASPGMRRRPAISWW